MAAACALAAATPAQAADTGDSKLAIGSALNTMLELRGKQILLPEGDWVVAGHGYEVVPELTDLAYGAVESVVLFKTDGKKVSAFVIAHRNVIPIEDGWGSASECARADIPLALTYDAEEGHTFCGFVATVDTSRADDSATSWKNAVAFAQAHGLTLPKEWRMAGFRLSNRSDVVDVRYHFDPALRPRPDAAAEPSATADKAFGLEP